MSEFIINDTTAATPIGELLRQAEHGEIVLLDENGTVIARLGLIPGEPIPDLTDEELAEIHRRLATDPANDLTIDELLARLDKKVLRT